MENKNEQVEQVKTMKMTKNLLTSSKSEGPMGPASGVIGSFIGIGPVGPGVTQRPHGYIGCLFWNWTHASC